MIDISIIVPVYNAENYLPATVAALLTQEAEKVEIILINDGSTDASENICKDLAKKHKNISYYTIENGGPSRARNYGLDKACGKYIGFCDADDLPDRHMYSCLQQGLDTHNTDIALCDIFSERDNRAFGFPWNGVNVFRDYQFQTEFIPVFIGNMSDNDQTIPVWGSVVRCLYKRALIEQYHIRFPEGISFAEDLVFTLRYLAHSKSAFVSEEPLYRYVWNRESLMNSFAKYETGMFVKRLQLVSAITEAINGMNHLPELTTRLKTTERCYYLECIGNACRKADLRNLLSSYRKIRKIVSHPMVTAAFATFDASDKKKKTVYSLIARKQALFLWGYYHLRFALEKLKRM